MIFWENGNSHSQGNVWTRGRENVGMENVSEGTIPSFLGYKFIYLYLKQTYMAAQLTHGVSGQLTTLTWGKKSINTATNIFWALWSGSQTSRKKVVRITWLICAIFRIHKDSLFINNKRIMQWPVLSPACSLLLSCIIRINCAEMSCMQNLCKVSTMVMPESI